MDQILEVVEGFEPLALGEFLTAKLLDKGGGSLRPVLYGASSIKCTQSTFVRLNLTGEISRGMLSLRIYIRCIHEVGGALLSTVRTELLRGLTYMSEM